MARWLIALIVVFPLPALADEPDPEPPSGFEGEWEVVSMKIKGEERKAPAGFTVTFRKGKMIMKRATGKETVNTYKIDPRKSPPHFDMKTAKGVRTRYGIYKLEKGELRLAYGTYNEAARPKDVDTATQVLVLKRKKK
jgi:uncharacterized protein (TIGR03067 family)